MPSSTSSSDATLRLTRGAAVRVALAVLFVIVGLEAFTRLELFHVSKDFRHFLGFPAAAAELGNGVALIGNSATRRGVDPEIVATMLSAGRRAGDLRAAVFAADASRINTWYFMLESTFWRPRVPLAHHPTLYVLTYYEDDLADGNRIEIGRVAQFFTTIDDWPDVFRVDLPTTSERAEFVVSSFWATYAARARIRERALGLITGYEDYIVAQNEVVYTHERRLAAARAPSSPTHLALVRLLDRARATHSRLCFVAYPSLEAAQGRPYAIDDTARRLIEQAGMTFLDLRHVDGLGPELYDDDVHLGERGRKVYSAALAAALAPLL